MRNAIALFGCLALGSCATTRTEITSVPLVNYSPAFQSAAAAELKTIEPIAPHVVTMVVDYGKTRQAIRKEQSAIALQSE